MGGRLTRISESAFPQTTDQAAILWPDLFSQDFTPKARTAVYAKRMGSGRRLFVRHHRVALMTDDELEQLVTEAQGPDKREAKNKVRKELDPDLETVCKSVLKLKPCGVDCEDGVQASRTDILKALINRQYDPDRACSGVRPWARCIARNACIDLIRKAAREQRLSTAYARQRSSRASPDDPTCLMEQAEEIECLHQALAQMEKDKHALIIMRYWEGYTFRQIADQANLKNKQQASRQIEDILAELSEELPE